MYANIKIITAKTRFPPGRRACCSTSPSPSPTVPAPSAAAPSASAPGGSASGDDETLNPIGHFSDDIIGLTIGFGWSGARKYLGHLGWQQEKVRKYTE